MYIYQYTATETPGVCRKVDIAFQFFLVVRDAHPADTIAETPREHIFFLPQNPPRDGRDRDAEVVRRGPVQAGQCGEVHPAAGGRAKVRET